jgi:elongation factor 3
MLKAATEDSSSALAREGALLVFSSLCEVVGKPAEPFLVPLLANVLACYCDKVRAPLVAVGMG